MSRPVVLVATTDPVMTYALGQRLEKSCRTLGLRLELCPDGAEAEVLGLANKPAGRCLTGEGIAIVGAARLDSAACILRWAAGTGLGATASPSWSGRHAASTLPDLR